MPSKEEVAWLLAGIGITILVGSLLIFFVLK